MAIEAVFSELEEVQQEIFRRKVKNFQIAEHASRFKGSGYEIQTISQWRLGEPMTNVDWNLSLRTWPKEIYQINHIETKNAPVILVLDISSSIFVEIDQHLSRFKLLLHLVGALGFAANYFHDPVGILAVAEDIEFYLKPRLGRGQIFYTTSLLLDQYQIFQDKRRQNKWRFEKSGINCALEMLSGVLRRQCSIVLLSDFTDTINKERTIDFRIIEKLSALHNWNVIALFLDDPLEFDWQNSYGLVRVRDSETGQIKKIRASKAKLIRDKFCEEREGLRRRFSLAGVDSTILSFGDHFNQLTQFLSERQSTRLN